MYFYKIKTSILKYEEYKYIMKITGDDKFGKAQVEYFINPKETYPVIVTTSELLSTGVDAKTCKLIVIDQNIQSMTKFKQIIGRGTRIDEDYNKTWFTILDFRGTTKKFADPDFDGPPVQIIETPSIPRIIDNPDIPAETKINIKYHIDGVKVTTESQQKIVYDSNGKPIKPESFTAYNKNILNNKFDNLAEFSNYWQQANNKTKVINELAGLGVIWDAFDKIDDNPLDEYDLILSKIYSQPSLTRKQRADLVMQSGFINGFNTDGQQIIKLLLDKYMQSGITELESPTVLKIPPFNQFGMPLEINNKAFGSSEAYKQTIAKLAKLLYSK